MYAVLSSRALLFIQGEDAKSFLQGLITNDIYKLTDKYSLYTALLNPQGRFLYDFFVVSYKGGLYLDVARDRVSDLIKHLTLYKLRAKITIEEVPSTHYQIIVLWGDKAFSQVEVPFQCGATSRADETIFFVDPRVITAGIRGIVLKDKEENSLGRLQEQKVSEEEYHCHRLILGLPEGSVDMPPDKAIPLECGLGDLNAIDWQKGCYIGQELTARTHYQGLVRKRLFPVTLQGPGPTPGTEIKWQGNSAGRMGSSQGSQGLALLRLEFVEEAFQLGIPFEGENGTLLVPAYPTWISIFNPS